MLVYQRVCHIPIITLSSNPIWFAGKSTAFRYLMSHWKPPLQEFGDFPAGHVSARHNIHDSGIEKKSVL